MALTLVIKGGKEAALAAAQARDIPISVVCTFDRWNETVAICHDDSFHNRIGMHWFAAPPHEAPFPDGTLLWFGLRTTEPGEAYAVSA